MSDETIRADEIKPGDRIRAREDAAIILVSNVSCNALTPQIHLRGINESVDGLDACRLAPEQEVELVERSRYLVTEMPDGTKWAVPVTYIARHRAKHYADEFDNDLERSLAEDTRLLFEDSDYEVEDWAVGSFNWKDVEPFAFKIEDSPKPDFQEGWLGGDKEVLDSDVVEFAPDTFGEIHVQEN